MFNILLVLIYLFADGLRLICWHIPEKSDFTFRVCVTLKLLLWSFVFLNLLPFNFLIPTLFGRKFYLSLNSFFLLWYGACVWNSVGFTPSHPINYGCCCVLINVIICTFNPYSPSFSICIIKFITPTTSRTTALAEARFQGTIEYKLHHAIPMLTMNGFNLYKSYSFLLIFIWIICFKMHINHRNRWSTSHEEHSESVMRNPISRYRAQGGNHFVHENVPNDKMWVFYIIFENFLGENLFMEVLFCRYDCAKT